jgi:hypothetical protein
MRSGTLQTEVDSPSCVIRDASCQEKPEDDERNTQYELLGKRVAYRYNPLEGAVFMELELL